MKALINENRLKHPLTQGGIRAKQVEKARRLRTASRFLRLAQALS